jgi:lipid-A-disaccharide synthase
MASIAVVAGEASGDQHAASLVQALRRLRPNLAVWAVGGPALRRAGAEIIFASEALAGMGLIEAAGRLPAVARARNLVVARFGATRPDLFVPVDFGGLNLRLARAAKSRGIPVVYYIPPKVWAWGGWRTRKLGRAIDEALVILPFEQDHLRERGVSATYVGSPVLDRLSPRSFQSEPDLVGLLPGSREGEVSRIWPLLLDAARLLSRRRRLRFLAARAPGLRRDTLEAPLRASGLAVEILDGEGQQVMERSRLALVASGTATLECALLGTPMVVVYRLNLLTYALGRALVRVPFISLPNLILGRRLVPELVQTGPEAVARVAQSLLDDGPERAAMTRGFAELRRELGESGASERAAARVLLHLEGRRCT